MAKRKRDGRGVGKKSGRRRPAARRTTGRTRAAARTSRKSPRRAVKRAVKVKRAVTVKRAKKKASATKTRGVSKVARRAPKAKTVRKATRLTRKPSVTGPTRPPAPSKTRIPPARLARPRRVLDEGVVQTPPSSLNMDRHGSAARTGRAEMAEHLADHATLTPSITAGDVDVNIEDAYFSGDEAPGGDNSTPDQDIVDDIGKALGVEYQDNEELGSADKLSERDKHRWELDPASSEDYTDRKK